MTWNHRYRLASYIRASLWIIPIAAIIVEQVVWKLVKEIDIRLGWNGLGLGVEGAKGLFGTVITLSLSFTVFAFGSLLVAIQVASGQYTPRIIATTLLRDNVIRCTVGLFVFTFIFAVKGLCRTETSVLQLVAFITGGFGFACIAAFLFLIDHAARLLRPVSLVQRVGCKGLAVLEDVYPEYLKIAESLAADFREENSEVRKTIHHRGASAIVLAVNVKPVIAEAKRTGGVIEFAPQVGDFVGGDEPLFFLRGDAAKADEHILRQCIVFGSERTMEQDPLFAFRILTDIAIKALSAAINDPTTAVLAIDQLHRLLRSAGRRNLHTDYISDSAGRLRVILRTPGWDDFVHLAFTEIRFYGVSNIQIARRVRAMIVNLAATLPPVRHAALRRQLELLDGMLNELYHLPEDLALARIADSQGLGGSTESGAPLWAA